MRHLVVGAKALGVMALVVAIMSACDSQPADASGMVVADDVPGGVTVVVPVCEGERLIGATYWSGSHYSTVDLRGAMTMPASEATTVDLDMSPTALESGALIANSVAGKTDPALAGLDFYELETVEIETTKHMIRIAPQMLDPDETALVHWAYPFGRNDPTITPVDEGVGREKLLDDCDVER